MAQPIYKFFRARMTEAWYQLSPKQQKQLFAKVEEALKKVGGKSVLTCNSYWTTEQWWFWGVEEYPSFEALQEHNKVLVGLHWMRYCQAETILGTPETA
jgi:hypothetical protein